MTITKNQCTRIYKHMRKLAESEERERYDKYTDVYYRNGYLGATNSFVLVRLDVSNLYPDEIGVAPDTWYVTDLDCKDELILTEAERQPDAMLNIFQVAKMPVKIDSTDVAFWLHNATEDLTIDVTLMKVKC